MSPQNENWLTLSEAADKLGVHATTLRRWADKGNITALVTPGGHRRFAQSEIDKFLQKQKGVTSQGVAQMWASAALTNTRREVKAADNVSWLTNLDDSLKHQHRQIGQQLMGLTMQYLSDETGNQHFLEEANKIGTLYGEISVAAKVPLPDALEAAMFFRDRLLETALQLPTNLQTSPQSVTRLVQRINELLNAVQLAISEVYYATYTNFLPGSEPSLGNN